MAPHQTPQIFGFSAGPKNGKAQLEEGKERKREKKMKAGLNHLRPKSRSLSQYQKENLSTLKKYNILKRSQIYFQFGSIFQKKYEITFLQMFNINEALTNSDSDFMPFFWKIEPSRKYYLY